MIGKVVQGQNFLGVLNYLHNKEKAQKIGGNLAGQTPLALSAELYLSRELNRRLQNIVCHTSLSLAKSEQLTDLEWRAIAADYLQAMGYRDCQHVIYRHHDQDHDHIHIVVSRIGLADGKTVKDSWEKRRAEAVLRDLERKYGLVAVPSSHTALQTAPTVGEMRKFEQTGVVPVRIRLQTQIDAAVGHCTTMADLIQRLRQRGIGVRLRIAEGQIAGISYSLDGIAFSGNKLGRAYTFPGLQQHKRIRYDHGADLEATCQAATGELAISAPPVIQNPEAEMTPIPATSNRAEAILPETARATPPESASTSSSTASKKSPKLDYAALWQHYAQGLPVSNAITVNGWVARRALGDGKSPQEAAQMLLHSPFVREMVQKRREPEKIRAYINQTVHQAYQQQSSSQQPHPEERRQQRSGEMEL